MTERSFDEIEDLTQRAQDAAYFYIENDDPIEAWQRGRKFTGQDLYDLGVLAKEQAEAIRRIQALAESMLRESPKPQVGGFLADQILLTLAGEKA